MNGRPRLVLHTGIPKTGTTALQESLAMNGDWFADRGISIPATGLGRNNGHRTALLGLRSPAPDANVLHGLVEDIWTSNADTIVLSGEILARFHGSEIARIASLMELAAATRPGAHVLVYVRNPVDAAQSDLLSVIAGARLPAATAIDAARPASELAPETWRQLHERAGLASTHIASVASWMGLDAVRVRPYVPARIGSAGTVADFVTALGRSIDDDFARPRHLVNRSLTIIDAHLLDEAEHNGIDAPAHRRLVDLLRDLPRQEDPTGLLHPSTRSFLARQHRGWSRQLVRRFPLCEAITSSYTVHLDVLDPDLVADRRAAVRAFDHHPTLLIEDQPTGAELTHRLHLGRGCRDMGDRGVEMDGTGARVGFRLHRAHLGGYGESILIRLGSRSAMPIRLAVRVNGRPPVCLDPEREAITIPRGVLGPGSTVDLEITIEGDGADAWHLERLEWDAIDRAQPDTGRPGTAALPCDADERPFPASLRPPPTPPAPSVDPARVASPVLGSDCTRAFVQTTSARSIAEIGVGDGNTTLVFAEHVGPGGVVHVFDFEARVAQVVQRVAQAGHANVVAHPNSDRALDSYTWSLGRLLAEQRAPIFDYVYIDGAHTWCHDALAFLLVDRLLRPGGHVDFDDYGWTIVGSPTNRERLDVMATRYTPEQLATPQVAMVVELLVKTDPRYEMVVTDRIFRKIR